MEDQKIGVWLSNVMTTVRGDEHFWPKLMIRAMVTDDLDAFSLSLKRIKEMPKGLSTVFGRDYFSYTVLHLLAAYSSSSFLRLVNVLDFSPELWRVKMAGNQARRARFNFSPIEMSIHNGSREFTAWSSPTVTLQVSADVMVKLAWDLVSASRFEEFSAMTQAMTDAEFMRYYHHPNGENLLSYATDPRLIQLLLNRGFCWEETNNKNELIAEIWLKNILRLVLNPGVGYPQSGRSWPELVDGLFMTVSAQGFPFDHQSGFAWAELYRMPNFSFALLPQLNINWRSLNDENGLLHMIEKNCVQAPPSLSGWKIIFMLIQSGRFDLTKKGGSGRSIEDWLRLWMDNGAPKESLLNPEDLNDLFEEEMAVIRAECRDWILSKLSSSVQKEIRRV